MIKLLQKLVILWEKSKFLTLLEMESEYLKQSHAELLERDTDTLRKEMAELKAIKQPNKETQQKIVELDMEIMEAEKFRQMVKSSEDKGLDLKSQIVKYKKELWS